MHRRPLACRGRAFWLLEGKETSGPGMKRTAVKDPRYPPRNHPQATSDKIYYVNQRMQPSLKLLVTKRLGFGAPQLKPIRAGSRETLRNRCLADPATRRRLPMAQTAVPKQTQDLSYLPHHSPLLASLLLIVKRPGMPEVCEPLQTLLSQKLTAHGDHHSGDGDCASEVAPELVVFTSERWSPSARNRGRLRVGIGGRLRAEYAPVAPPPFAVPWRGRLPLPSAAASVPPRLAPRRTPADARLVLFVVDQPPQAVGPRGQGLRSAPNSPRRLPPTPVFASAARSRGNGGYPSGDHSG